MLLVALAAWLREASPEWEDRQEAVRRAVRAAAGDAAANALPEGIQQIWLPELGRADRCTTCHGAMDLGEALASAEHPARSHPLPDLMAKHPVERFGCTVCHGGPGLATTTEAAHGTVPFWDEPIATTRRAKAYGLTRAELMEANCNACHRRQDTVEGMPLLNEAKALVARIRCFRCHVIDGAGRSAAPELTEVGSKPPEHLAFPAGWTKTRTALRWHMEHFLDPSSVVPDSEMDTYLDLPGSDAGPVPLTDRQAAALALLVLSWRRASIPAAWLPR